MKFVSRTAILAMLLTAITAQAQMYKWVGPDGKVNYTDTPPPKSAQKVEQKNLDGSSGVDTANLPYELAQAVKNSPVTLYTTPKCPPCDDGRAYLNKRGVPFREKTVSTPEDQEKLTQATGDKQLPVLLVGRNKQTGYEAGAWGTLLNAAGYPESSRLPKNFQNAAAESAAPKATAANSKSSNDSAPATPSISTQLPSTSGNAPPGFRF